MQDTLIQQLSSKGILAYVAVSMLGNGEVTTAALAELVKSQAGAIREGLHELSLVAPVVCRKAPKNKWSCGEIQAGDGVIVQILDYHTVPCLNIPATPLVLWSLSANHWSY